MRAATPAPQRARTPVAINYWLVVPVAVVLLVIVSAWASRDRGAPGTPAAEARALSAPGKESSSSGRDLSESDARSLIEDCSYFGERLWIRFPKTFRANQAKDAADRYPALLAAANTRVVEFDPPFNFAGYAHYPSDPSNPGVEIYVYPSAWIRNVNVTEVGDEFHYDLGYRKLEHVHSFVRSSGKVTVEFIWGLDKSPLAHLAPDYQYRRGGAEFRATSSGSWEAASIWVNTKLGRRVLCQS